MVRGGELTQVAQKSQGIQTLLEAEKEASKIVEKARAYRTQKLKDAQSEAEKDIAALKQKNDKAIADFQKQFEGSSSQEQGALDKDTKQQLDEIRRAFEAKDQELIQKLLDRVAAVDPQPHRNLAKVSEA
ncbi:triacylglycerol lipase [Malassezia obtusa]|uniref:V-type proton ATPase subunit G n=1 Tax=Malassezia obtusa TaxID=76774 RepID=A0AAF0DY75_9BASI|nr:triacylglycerol lipase [Malassezia obtusa]